MEYTTTDLERQDAQLLPEREALGFFNYAGLTANNTALALNAGSWMSRARATAVQRIVVVQR